MIRLSTYPFGRVRIRCPACPRRRGDYSLARLAVRLGPEMPIDEVLWHLTQTCQWQVPPGTKRRKYVPYCRAYFVDLDHGGPKPDEPPANTAATDLKPHLRLVGTG